MNFLRCTKKAGTTLCQPFLEKIKNNYRTTAKFPEEVKSPAVKR